MLTLSPTATAVVTSIVGQQSAQPTAGLRIGNEGDQYTVAVVEAPAADDVVIEKDGARVFLDGEVAPSLDDRQLEAQVDEAGAVSFGLAAQTA